MRKNVVINIMVIQAFLLIFFSVQYYESHNKIKVMDEVLEEQESKLAEIELENKELKNEIVETKIVSENLQKNLRNVIEQNGVLIKRNKELTTEISNMIVVGSNDKTFEEKIREYNSQLFKEYSEQQIYHFD